MYLAKKTFHHYHCLLGDVQREEKLRKDGEKPTPQTWWKAGCSPEQATWKGMVRNQHRKRAGKQVANRNKQHGKG